MISPGSRYEIADRLFTLCHVYDKYSIVVLEGDVPNTTIKTVSRNTTYMPLLQPALPQTVEYYAKETEGMQFLSYKFMGDSRQWHEIAGVNPEIWYPLDMLPGDYIRIPTS